MEHIAEENRSELVMAVRQLDDISRYGTLTHDKQRKVTGFIEKKGEPVPGIINGGVYWLDKSLFLQHSFPFKFSFENDYLMKFYPEAQFHAALSQGYFIDIGIPETYHQAQSDFFNFSE
jgi:D-glycero-alpha-D-manno-heptose 1-phosphate guanylyltransferase